jgi:methionyl-tRNA formyltransferase
MKTIGLFAYGEMGETALCALIPKYTVQWIILPPTSIQTESEHTTEQTANKHHIPVIYYTNKKQLYNFVQDSTPEVILIASFNQILTPELLALTKFINIHLGDLPRYRGRANINWAIINGRHEIGVTVHEVIPALDAGNIYLQKLLAISDHDTVKNLYDKINTFLQENLCDVIDKVLSGYNGIKQKGTATYCCTRIPEDGLIDWSKQTKEIYNLIRGLTRPYPGAFTYFEGKRVIVWDAEIPNNPKIFEGSIPGRVASVIQNKGVEVLTGDGVLLIKTIHFEGRDYNASEIITSIKATLGINWVDFYEKIQNVLQQYEH